MIKGTYHDKKMGTNHYLNNVSNSIVKRVLVSVHYI